jgi:hypothetical protein
MRPTVIQVETNSCLFAAAAACRSPTGYLGIKMTLTDSVRSVTFKTASGSDSAQYGDSQGGSPSELLCPADLRVVGIAGRADRVLEALQVLCEGERAAAVSD